MQDWEWSGKYPEQPEILRYLNHVADRFDLRRNIQFNTRVTAAHYNEATNRWEIETDTGDTVTAQFLITADRLPVDRARSRTSRAARPSRATRTTPAPGLTRVSTSPASASA